MGQIRTEYVGVEYKQRVIVVRPLYCMMVPPPIVLASWIQAAAQDCCDYTVDKALNLDRNRDKYLEDAIVKTIPDINKYELADMVRFLYEGGLTTIVNDVMDVVWSENFAVWVIDGRMDCIYLHYLGDYRIMEWEREHVNQNGQYQSVPDPCK